MLKRSGDLFLGSKCCVVMQRGMRMQIVVCISMIYFMPGNGDHKTSILPLLRERWCDVVALRRDITHYKTVEQILCS